MARDLRWKGSVVTDRFRSENRDVASFADFSVTSGEGQTDGFIMICWILTENTLAETALIYPKAGISYDLQSC